VAHRDSPVRRGRPRGDEREERRRRILDAALDVLAERGYQRATMLAVASRAGASKETLYAWFGSREGLFRALIETNADASVRQVEQALASDDDPGRVLTHYAENLLALLTDRGSVVLNRAAMTSSELATVLLASGRHRAGPAVANYLARLDADGYLRIDDPDSAFRLLYGLVVQDTQISVLLGQDPPSAVARSTQARRAVERFLVLTGAHQEPAPAPIRRARLGRPGSGP
jgi:AcrR family transcriptional regulator